MYNVIKSSASSNGYDKEIIASFDNKKEALVCKIGNNWKSMAKYKRDEIINFQEAKEDFVFDWGELQSIFIGTPPCFSNPIPISKEVLMTYDSEKLEYISKSQGRYFQEGSSVCYIEDK